MSARLADEDSPGDPPGKQGTEQAGQTSSAEKEEHFSTSLERLGSRKGLDDEATEETDRAACQNRSGHDDGGAEGQEKLAEDEDQQGDRRSEYKDDQKRKGGTHDLTD